MSINEQSNFRFQPFSRHADEAFGDSAQRVELEPRPARAYGYIDFRLYFFGGSTPGPD